MILISHGLSEKSFQGDKKIVEICEKIVYNKNGGLQPFDLDCSDIPDLVPVLTVLGSFCEGKSYIRNAARLRIKECDRLSAISQCLNAIGGKVTELEDGLEIEGVGSLNGGEVDSFNDHQDRNVNGGGCHKMYFTTEDKRCGVRQQVISRFL